MRFIILAKNVSDNRIDAVIMYYFSESVATRGSDWISWWCQREKKQNKTTGCMHSL